eukprot:6195443-Pleurochrysis_carterae.AAC.3
MYPGSWDRNRMAVTARARSVGMIDRRGVRASRQAYQGTSSTTTGRLAESVVFGSCRCLSP